MRVIAGSARHLQLKTVEGDSTRPTTDRIKETLFNMLQNDIAGSRFLDLFSGSGAIGIEALSRGAGHAVFVENGRKALDCIKYNLQFTKLADKADVIGSDVLEAVRKLDQSKPFDLIFMDPPYNQEWEKKVLDIIKDTTLADEYTMIIVEASLDTKFDYLEDMGYRIKKYKKYKTNAHVFIEKAC